ncbi:GbsR/MarR family transcriptional regulator [Aestuariispira insulae]|uniref:HTH-type transcriptional regulator n=1 Tax=Aestuariispira insulae TaxID=1461337 RepID=A0A3D9HPZ8_9PROT|nr:MarR family transcriptional regulator [Aestuariispira insulae]RED51552.1 DNA-binding transcriptional regulator GbsR (MarR family) [Aestuariispira insulae]
MQLTAPMEKFILHWGEMGTRWGVNRSVAQVHALLYLMPKPLSADDIVETLSMARSNVSNSLKELQSWGLVRVTHILGDRRDHFETSKDMWELFSIIVEERKRREIDPTLTMLRQCVLEFDTDTETPADVKERIQNTLTFIETLTLWYDKMKALPRGTQQLLIKMGDKVARFIGKNE